MSHTLGLMFLKELEAEAPAARKCIERIPFEIYNWKPHEKSMALGYLVLIVAEIPKWITATIDPGVIDFGTWERFQAKSTEDMVKHFDECLEGARQALKNVSDEALKESFSLRNNGQVLMSSPKDESISSSLNHWVHHRGQLTVYMRFKDIPVPSIYGPSADEKTF